MNEDGIAFFWWIPRIYRKINASRIQVLAIIQSWFLALLFIQILQILEEENRQEEDFFEKWRWSTKLMNKGTVMWHRPQN